MADTMNQRWRRGEVTFGQLIEKYMEESQVPSEAFFDTQTWLREGFQQDLLGPALTQLVREGKLEIYVDENNGAVTFGPPGFFST